ncbi:MAG TPA: hypothetical protein VLZ05_00060 [Mycobacterium sp.]|nr:hypothetical protein [Mycobacterium sp.]HUH67416.1 hypothetical protein [Mycobacterium sp.]
MPLPLPRQDPEPFPGPDRRFEGRRGDQFSGRGDRRCGRRTAAQGASLSAKHAEPDELTELRPGVYAFNDAMQLKLGATTIWTQVATGPYRAVTLDGAGHWLQEERPTEVSAEITRYLADLNDYRPPADAPTLGDLSPPEPSSEEFDTS